MNVKLLRKVAKHIAEEPKRLVMSDWIQTKPTYSRVQDGNYGRSCKTHDFAPCGTAACIGGWTEILKYGSAKLQGRSASLLSLPDASQILGLSKEQEDRLFFNHNWPKKFEIRYENAKTPRGKASAAVARIEHFIKTKGAE